MLLSRAAFTKKKIIYVLNAFLVLLTLFLAYRILSPSYERKESLSINKLGTLHTQLSAERVVSKLSNFREELRENGMRLVDPTRGPITLDSARWLWLRIQDRDWRAPNFLEPLPVPFADVDTWTVKAYKNSLVISERIPILKNGVQDFVLLEGGLRSSVLQDLQSNSSFGLWVFDLKAYEKGGIGAAKVYEKASESGYLAKDEVKLLTSDLLMRLFQKEEPITLDAKFPWVVAFKKSGGPTELGVLGYWVPDPKPVELTTVWLSLGLVLLLMSGFVSYLIVFIFKSNEKTNGSNDSEKVLPQVPPSLIQLKDTDQENIKQKNNMQIKAFDELFDWLLSFSQQNKNALNDLRDRVRAAVDILSRSSDVSSVEAKSILLNGLFNFDKLNSFFGRFESYFSNNEADIEVFDPEMFYLELRHSSTELPKVDTFFDPDIWRVRASKEELGYLLIAYLKYLEAESTPESKLHLACRYLEKESSDSGSIEVLRSQFFKIPFIRFHLHLATTNPLGRTHIQELFDLTKARNSNEVSLALTQRIVERMGGRIRVKSNFEDGNVIILDIPAHGERKPEDKVNAKQFVETSVGPEFKTHTQNVMEKPPVIVDPSQDNETIVSSSIDLKQGVSISPDESTHVSDKQSFGSFAENISDERSRVRSRFRIRRPGEK